MYENAFSKRVILSILQAHDWSERRLAKKCGISASEISRHLSGQRKIQVEHLIKYLDALDRQEASQLLVAWLRDRVGLPRVHELMEAAGGNPHVDMTGWHVDRQHEEMLQWWARETMRDPELEGLFEEISARFGYHPKRKRR